MNMEKISILGVSVSNTTKQKALEFIVKGLEQKTKKLMIFTPNPEIIMFAQKDIGFKNIFNKADLALADGVGVTWAAKILGKQLRARITGVDFMEGLCDEAAKRAFTVGLIGGGPKIAERTAECLRLRYPKLKIAFAESGWDQVEPEYRETREKSTVDRSQWTVDILFVAFGFPKQERWIYEHIYSVPVQVAMGVGGSFDYLSGNVPRASSPLRRAGLEWLFRLIVQPWRLLRQLVIVGYVILVFKERITLNTS